MKPTNKLIAGVLAGAVTTIAVWAARAFGHVELPGEVQGALTVILTAVTQYIVPDAVAAPNEE